MNSTLEFAKNQSFDAADLIRVKIQIGEVNKWMDLRNSGFMVFWRFFMSLLSGATATVALYKIIVFVKVQGVRLSVPQLTLLALFVGSTFRCAYTAVDPIYMNYAGTLGFQGHMMASIHFPINVITTLLLALYWKVRTNIMRLIEFLVL